MGTKREERAAEILRKRDERLAVIEAKTQERLGRNKARRGDLEAHLMEHATTVPLSMLLYAVHAGFQLDVNGPTIEKGRHSVRVADAHAEIVQDSTRQAHRLALHKTFAVTVTGTDGTLLVGKAKNRHRESVIKFVAWVNAN